MVEGDTPWPENEPATDEDEEVEADEDGESEEEDYAMRLRAFFPP